MIKIIIISIAVINVYCLEFLTSIKDISTCSHNGVNTNIGFDINQNNIFDENEVIESKEHCIGTTYFYDMRDNQEYRLVNIGEQTWFAENLNFMPENNSSVSSGIEIYSRRSNTGKIIAGLYYTYEEALNVCPIDFSLPTDDDWNTLAQYVNVNTENNGLIQNGNYDDYLSVGKYLKSEVLFDGNNSSIDLYGFSIFPTGLMYKSGIWNYGFTNAKLWSSTSASSTHAWARGVGSNTDGFFRHKGLKKSFRSVRCIKD